MKKEINEENSISEYKADGVNNFEHILDEFDQMKILRENISDNTDLAFNMLKAIKDDGEDDVVDSLTIYCSEILEQEKLAKEVFDKAEVLVENAKNIKENDKLSKMENMLMEYFSALKLNEKNSSERLTKVLKSFK